MRTIFFIFCCCFTLQATAQLAPVKWSFEAEKVNDKEYNIIFTADIDRGWSVYSQYLESKDGPIPTKFAFNPSAGLELVGKMREMGNKKESFDQLFGMKLVKFMRKAKFTQRVKINAAATSVEGQLTYMTCNGKSCLPPENIDFNISLRE